MAKMALLEVVMQFRNSIYGPSVKPEGLYKTQGRVRDLYSLSANRLESIGSRSI